MRKGAHQTIDGQSITASMITNDCQRHKILNTDRGYQFLKTIRGSPPYWEKCLRDLFAMVKQLGIPTWFCSFSAADRRWPEILEAICKQQGKEVPQNPDWTKYCHLMNSNPVTACRMFEHRVLSFISSVILSPASPIGKVKDYFYRTEFQSRGWPHIHCLFWCQDAPTFKTADNTEVDNTEFIEYIDKYITCALPSEENEDLHNLVVSVQTHSKHHSRSCKKGSTTCRFHFPRPPSTRTFIAQPTSLSDSDQPALRKKQATALLTSVHDITDNIDTHGLNSFNEILHSLHITQEDYEKAHSILAKRNTVIFQRDVNDQWVNPYNEHLLRAWNGNMDIQPVLDPYSCIMYIVSYISKAEREMGDLLRKAQEEAQEGHLEPMRQLRKLGNVYLNAREISVMEAVYRACGMQLKQSSREIVFVPADKNASRITKPIEVLRQSDSTTDDIWMTNIVDRYLSRPTANEFEDMSLAYFASNYRVCDRSGLNSDHSDNTSENNYKIYKLLNSKGSIVKRKTLAVIRYTNYNKDKNSENYYYNLISMYFPHRDREFKSANIQTYEHFFNQNSHIILPNMKPFENLSFDLNEIWQRLQEEGPPENVWADVAPNQEVNIIEEEEELDLIRREMLEVTEELDLADIPDIFNENINTCPSNITQNTAPVPKQDHSQMVRALNEKQSKIFNFVKNWADRKEHEDAEQFLLFLTGGAGTGKSHTIRCIYNEVDRTITRKSENAESPVVLLVAYTGTAAYNIGGQTIHSALNINHCKQLPEESANTLRSRLHDLQLLIIDEVSMVSTDLLNLVHCRLQQVKKPPNSNSVFGNVSVLAVGDFFQIPPVRGRSLISVNNSLTDLWSFFSIWNLTEVVRQKGDSDFAEMLNRLRVKQKHQNMDIGDLNFLQTRLVNTSSSEYPDKVLHIAATHKQLDVINAQRLKQLSDKETMFSIQAVDICHDRKSQKSFKRNEPLLSKDATLLPELQLCVGTRVMLTHNLDVSDGLTNGVIGTVTAVITGQMSLGLPSAICVLFDYNKIGSKSREKHKSPPNVNQMSTVIKPHTEVIQKSPYQITRHQYPFMLAWAITIHKTQGLTTDKAIVSLKGIFKPGMAYVALSRVTTGQGLYLLDSDFDTSVIYCDANVSKQLDNMTRAETLHQWKIVHVADEIKPQPDHLLVASHNCEGLLPHFMDISQNQLFQRADIINIQETWTNSNMTVDSPLCNHNLILQHRRHDPEQQKYTKGGVGILIHHDFEYAVLDTSAVDIECISIRISTPPLTILNVYRPPNYPLQHFCNQLGVLCRQLNYPVVITGDFNVNILKSQDNRLSDTLSEYQQVIATPTTRRRTLIDHIYVRNATIMQSGVVPTSYSYHDATFISLSY